MLAPIEEIFCEIDDFCKGFYSTLRKKMLGSRKRNRPSSLCVSEIITIMILFHMSHYRTFKDFYYNCVMAHLRTYFPRLVSYQRFVELQSEVVIPMSALLSQSSGEKTGTYYVDSTSIKSCRNQRINRHRVFKGIAQRGKTSMGWFYGFKLHVIINHKGEIISFVLTPGNVDDRKPVRRLCKSLKGWIFGDKGYISQSLKKDLAQNGLHLFTRARKNMKRITLSILQKYFLSKRGIIETIFDQLKNIYQIEHTRHRSPNNFLANTLCALAAYKWRPNKPSALSDRFPLENLVLTSN